MKKQLVKIFVLGAFAVSLSFGSALAAAEKVNLGHIAPPFHGQSKGLDAFADHIRAKTNGRIDIATFPVGQLGGERSLASQTQSGALPISAITTAVLQNFVKEVAVLDLPFLFPNLETVHDTLDDPEVTKRMFSYLPKKGFIGVGWAEDGMRSFLSAKGPMRSPADFKGLKVRVMNSPAYMDTFEALGASAVGIPFPEVYNALQTGVIDAAESSLLVASLMKFPEVTKYITRSNYALTSVIIVVNRDYWETLSDEDHKIFYEAGKIAAKVNREVNDQLRAKLYKKEVSVVEFLKQQGVELLDLTDAELAVFKKVTAPVWVKYRKSLGDDLVDFILGKAKEHNK
jgi:tripartite ATP-independent transporter DctP family solute receptor